MRRSVIALVVGALISVGMGIAPTEADTTVPDVPVADEAPPSASPPPGVDCYSVQRQNGTAIDLCDHGPDVPADLTLGLPLESYPQYDASALTPQATPGIKCYGDGTSGIRVQAVYVLPPGPAPPPSALNARLDQIKTYAAQVETEVAASAQQTGGERHVKWVTNASCDLDIMQVTLTSATSPNLSTNATEMANMGNDRSDRLYLMWVEAAQVCGVGNLSPLDTPTSMNTNTYGPRFTRVDVPCFGIAETHELGHNMGAVQVSAPHSTAGGHCIDEWDIMCYADGSLNPRTGVNAVMDDTNKTNGKCPGTPDTSTGPSTPGTPGTGYNRLYDCNHDDYFHTNPTAGNYLVDHWNIANHPVLAQTDSTGTTGAGGYHSLTRPVRVADTRFANSPAIWGPPGPTYSPTAPSNMTVRPMKLTPRRSYVAKVTGFDVGGAGLTFPQTPLVSEAGVPNVGVAAVVLTVTVIDPSSAGFLSIRPYDVNTFAETPTISNINYVVGQVIPNTVTITVPAHGLIEVYSSAGAPFVIFDVAGWFADASGTFVEKGAYHALTPTRVMNTRTGLGGSTKLTPNTTVNLKLTGGAVDTTHAAAAVVNVTAAETTASSYLTVWPKGEARPNASSVNFPLGGAAANLVVVGIGADGSISIYLETGSANVIVDLLGWFDGGGPGAPAGAVYRAIAPTRLVDTRIAQAPKLTASETRAFALRGLGGVPNDASVTAVIANVAAVAPTGGGYLTAFPTGGAQPDTSTVNFEINQDRANLSFITLGGTGQSSVFAFGAPTHVLIDVAGYFTTA
ncbi:MAG: hypothetical protein ABIQ73_10310 [Acidimicrobiales bacterium]